MGGLAAERTTISANVLYPTKIMATESAPTFNCHQPFCRLHQRAPTISAITNVMYTATPVLKGSPMLFTKANSNRAASFTKP